jgi:hypothetical protein
VRDSAANLPAYLVGQFLVTSLGNSVMLEKKTSQMEREQ